jgi:hypothetical protein
MVGKGIQDLALGQRPMITSPSVAQLSFTTTAPTLSLFSSRAACAHGATIPTAKTLLPFLPKDGVDSQALAAVQTAGASAPSSGIQYY